MRTDENGSPCPATLGEYRGLVSALMGEGNKAVEFLDGKIEESPDGPAEIVTAPDFQMRALLFGLMLESTT